MEKFTLRREYLEKLFSFKDKDLIKVITGLRRSGKSTLLKLYSQQLLEQSISSEQIQFYNFELPENYLGKSWDDIYFEIKSKLKLTHQNYVFLDKCRISHLLKN